MSPPPHSSGCLPEGLISPFDLASASYLYESMTDYAGSLHTFRTGIGIGDDLDLCKEDHRQALLEFLNAWGCRGLAVDWHWLALAELERWYPRARKRLEGFDCSLSDATARSQRDLAAAFDELSTAKVAERTSRGRQVSVSFGPTAAAKTLFVLRPSLFPAWDAKIRDTCGYGRDGESYARYVEHVHDKIDESKQHFRQCGFALETLPQVLGREGYTTLVQLFGDYYWVTLTREVRLRGRDEVSQWLSWVADVD